MAYNASYTVNDMDDILIDVLGSAGVQIVGMIGLIVIVGLLVFVLRRIKRIR